LLPGVAATNEPSRIECGAPDYIITKKGIPIGFIEAKDVGADLNNRIHKEQFDRYRASLKDRKGRTLLFDDILHYQKIIVALSETDRIMKEIDKIEFE
jgi:hypothetical protein